MTNDDEQPARLRSFDLTNVAAQAAHIDEPDDSESADDDEAIGRSDDSARTQR